MSVPRLKAELITSPRIVICLLQDMKILKGSTAIVLYGIVLTDDILILILDIQLFVTVAVFVIIWRR